MRVLLLLAIFGPLNFVSLGAVGVIDYDEALYAEVSRDLHARGEYILPRYNGEDFNHKPPLLYWSQVAGYAAFGVGAFGARAGTALAGLLGLIVLYGFARRPLGPNLALLAAFVLGTSLQYAALSRVALTDMQLTTCLIVCLGCLHRAVEASELKWRGTSWFLLACLFSGFAMLAKGLVGLVLPAGAFFIFLVSERRLRLLLRPVWMFPGLIILTGVGCSWYILVWIRHPGGAEFMRALFVEQHFGRFTSSMDGHDGPIFYFLPVLLAGLMPWSPFFLLGAARRSKAPRSGGGTRFVRLFAIFSLLTLLFFSISATKLPNYVTPALPGFALLIACILFRQQEGQPLTGLRWRLAVGLSTTMFLLFAAALFVLPWNSSRAAGWLGEKAEKAPGLMHPVELGVGPYVAGALLLLGGAAVFLAYRRDRPGLLIASLGATSILLCVTLFLLVLPRYDRHFNQPLRDLARQAAELVPEGERIILHGLRRRPSVIYYGGRGTEEVRIGLDGRPPPPRDRVQVGISTYYYLEQAQALDRVDILAEKVGYVLFRTRVE